MSRTLVSKREPESHTLTRFVLQIKGSMPIFLGRTDSKAWILWCFLVKWVLVVISI